MKSNSYMIGMHINEVCVIFQCILNVYTFLTLDNSPKKSDTCDLLYFESLHFAILTICKHIIKFTTKLKFINQNDIHLSLLSSVVCITFGLCTLHLWHIQTNDWNAKVIFWKNLYFSLSWEMFPNLLFIIYSLIL